MSKLFRVLLGTTPSVLLISLMTFSGTLGGVTYALASPTSNFTQTINAGSLAVDIVDGSYASVGSPSVAMGAYTFSFACGTSTGTFGSGTQQLYVSNPDAADNGWTMTVAGQNTTSVWDSAGTDFDFNDSYGCTDGGTGDADSLAGRMTVNPNAGTLSAGNCASCNTTNITKGSSAQFIEGNVTSITMLTAAAGSDDIGDWKLTDVAIAQSIPREQPAAADYDIYLILSVQAS